VPQRNDTYEDLKADLDKATGAGGWLAVKQNSKPKHVILACSRGAQRQSTATTSNASTIKAGCQWSAVAHATKRTSEKWKLVIHEHRHTHHGPQEVPEAQRGWVKLSPEHHEFLAQAARDPKNATPGALTRLLCGQFPGIQLGPNTLKNWLQTFRKDRQGMYTSTQAALDWLERRASGTASLKIGQEALPASSGMNPRRWLGFENVVLPIAFLLIALIRLTRRRCPTFRGSVPLRSFNSFMSLKALFTLRTLAGFLRPQPL
jgi:hypothetical protein